MFNASTTMMRFRRYSIDLYRSLDAFDAVGIVRIASTKDALRELERDVSRARGIGLEVHLMG